MMTRSSLFEYDGHSNHQIIMREQRGKGRSTQLHSSNNSAATQPVHEARNVRRTQQIKALHLEFEDLKKKIKDVENKN